MACLRDNFQNGVLLDGRYKTMSPLNHGSFGMVFMAKDTKTDDTVAIKCLTKKEAADDFGFDFAIDEKSEELVLHRHLGSHPNIVNLLNTFETESHLYLVLEFCPQGDLYEAIRNGQGPLETEHVRQFMLQLVDAVDYIHSKGVFHRDIKPENIFLTKSGDMKLGDFGLATTENWTLENTVGSDRYMSPEQYDSAGAGYSPAQADIWAIGICLLNILFSRNPFTTPTEADPLFLDFSRDKQSLFDVFPSMSQDTYEVIAQCMSLDPKKRSLVAARAALQRVVSFTTTEEDDDDFCCAERHVMASANREPLRTPSIQSPQVDQGAFPWAKALHTTPPKPIRQLSAIADDESYTEDLFSKSGETSDWFSSAQTPSISSTLNSSLGASMKLLHIGRPMKAAPRPIPKVSPMAGSLPINMTKPRSNLSSMSLVFGRKDVVSKSWSDMWDEDEEEEEAEAERERQMQSLKDLNSRTWSHDSKLDDQDDCDTVDATPIATTPQRSHHDSHKLIHNDIDSDHAADGFFFQQSSPPKSKPMLTTPQSPPKRDNLDKWSALGQRRRGLTGSLYSQMSPEFPRQRTIGLSYNSYAAGVSDHIGHHITHNKSPKEKVKYCPWNKGRDWNYWRKEKRNDLADVEWVGGWQEAHS
ncbi:Serine/threonine-protein kinase ksp1 [Colletotrichum tanaceti]|uniref:Serine/threonine-protein kinase ksp1 n=1 Tax=Colletotrichum tanaceti TaxID=1306861 RepID=A0A4U6XFR9_9PEZI|nr:Serine/threonine-protein kinase ksp1 [Colletotrichum tanaceti]TKW54303.1 Serine/threonine-protein kinase ksp1 [Colletotrichum tanaceti]